MWMRSRQLVDRVAAATIRCERLRVVSGAMRTHCELRRRLDQDAARFCLPPGAQEPRQPPKRTNVGRLVHSVLSTPPTELFIEATRRRVRAAVAATYEAAMRRSRAGVGAPAAARQTRRQAESGLRRQPAPAAVQPAEKVGFADGIDTVENLKRGGQSSDRSERHDALGNAGAAPSYTGIAARRNRLQEEATARAAADQGAKGAGRGGTAVTSRASGPADPLLRPPEAESIGHGAAGDTSPRMAALHVAQSRILARALDAEADALRACEREADRDFLLQQQVARRDPEGLRDAVIAQAEAKQQQYNAFRRLESRQYQRTLGRGSRTPGSGGIQSLGEVPVGSGGRSLGRPKSAAGSTGEYQALGGGSGEGLSESVSASGSRLPRATTSERRAVFTSSPTVHEQEQLARRGSEALAHHSLQPDKVESFLHGPIDPIERHHTRKCAIQGQSRLDIGQSGRQFGRQRAMYSSRPSGIKASATAVDAESPPRKADSRPARDSRTPPPPRSLRFSPFPRPQPSHSMGRQSGRHPVSKGGSLKPGLDFEAQSWRTDDFATPSPVSSTHDVQKHFRMTPAQGLRQNGPGPSLGRPHGHLPWLDGATTQQMPTSLDGMRRQLGSMDRALQRERRRRHDRDAADSERALQERRAQRGLGCAQSHRHGARQTKSTSLSLQAHEASEISPGAAGARDGEHGPRESPPRRRGAHVSAQGDSRAIATAASVSGGPGAKGSGDSGTDSTTLERRRIQGNAGDDGVDFSARSEEHGDSSDGSDNEEGRGKGGRRAGDDGDGSEEEISSAIERNGTATGSADAPLPQSSMPPLPSYRERTWSGQLIAGCCVSPEMPGHSDDSDDALLQPDRLPEEAASQPGSGGNSPGRPADAAAVSEAPPGRVTSSATFPQGEVNDQSATEEVAAALNGRQDPPGARAYAWPQRASQLGMDPCTSEVVVRPQPAPRPSCMVASPARAAAAVQPRRSSGGLQLPMASGDSQQSPETSSVPGLRQSSKGPVPASADLAASGTVSEQEHSSDVLQRGTAEIAQSGGQPTEWLGTEQAMGSDHQASSARSRQPLAHPAGALDATTEAGALAGQTRRRGEPTSHAQAGSTDTGVVAVAVQESVRAAVTAAMGAMAGWQTKEMQPPGPPAAVRWDSGRGTSKVPSVQEAEQTGAEASRKYRARIRQAAAAVVRARMLRLGRSSIRRMRRALVQKLLLRGDARSAATTQRAGPQLGEQSQQAVVLVNAPAGSESSEFHQRSMPASPPKQGPLPASKLSSISPHRAGPELTGTGAVERQAHKQGSGVSSQASGTEGGKDQQRAGAQRSSRHQPGTRGPGIGTSERTCVLHSPTKDPCHAGSGPPQLQTGRVATQTPAAGSKAGKDTEGQHGVINMHLMRKAFSKRDPTPDGRVTRPKGKIRSPQEQARARLAAHRVARMLDGRNSSQPAYSDEASSGQLGATQKGHSSALLRSYGDRDPSRKAVDSGDAGKPISLGGPHRPGETSQGRLQRMRAEAALATALHHAMRQQLTASTAALLSESEARDAAESSERQLRRRADQLARHSAALQEQLEMARREAAEATITAASSARDFGRKLGQARGATVKAEHQRNRLQASLETVLEAAREHRDRAQQQLEALQRIATAAHARVAKAEGQVRRAAAAAKAVVGQSRERRMRAEAAAAACRRAQNAAVAAQRVAVARQEEAQQAATSARMRFEAAEEALFERRRLVALRRGQRHMPSADVVAN